MPAVSASLSEWLLRLEQRSPQEIVLGLDRVAAVIDVLAPALPRLVFTIGGTNGKGSSVELAQNLFAQAGYVTGAYTSPHLLRYNERIRVNCEPVTDEEIVAAFERIEVARGDTPLTYFEVGTIAALLVFEAHDVDVAILEVGMGGRLDAVNAIEPTASLVTNVSLDHCEWLGHDVESIAAEKAGIFRPRKPAIYAARGAPRAILARAGELEADLRLLGQDFGYDLAGDAWHWWGRKCRLGPLVRPAVPGRAQVCNAAGVFALLEAAGCDDLLTLDAANRALSALCMPGRMQQVRDGQSWLLDVAHNAAAAKILADNLRENFVEGPTIAIIGMLEDKDVESWVAPLRPLVDHWIAFKARSHRAIDAGELARRIANATNRACLEAASAAKAIGFARDLCEPGGRIVVTGSFYSVGPVLESLGLYSRPG